MIYKKETFIGDCSSELAYIEMELLKHECDAEQFKDNCK